MHVSWPWFRSQSISFLSLLPTSPSSIFSTRTNIWSTSRTDWIVGYPDNWRCHDVVLMIPGYHPSPKVKVLHSLPWSFFGVFRMGFTKRSIDWHDRLVVTFVGNRSGKEEKPIDRWRRRSKKWMMNLIKKIPPPHTAFICGEVDPHFHTNRRHTKRSNLP